MKLADYGEVRSGSLHDRSGTGGYYVLVSDLTRRGLNNGCLAEGGVPQKSGAAAALAPGDVVVGLRGASNVAAVVPSLEFACGLIFATLDVGIVRQSYRILPAYLAWFLNRPKTQAIFSSERMGSGAPRLPLSALQELIVPVPSLKRQATIAALAADAQRESDLIENIQQARQRLLDELLRQAADEGPAPGINPARANHRSHSRGATGRALSNPEDRKH